MNTYTIYSEWFLQHYGYQFPMTQAQWDQYCLEPQRDTRSAIQRDIDDERKEGWAYGD